MCNDVFLSNLIYQLLYHLNFLLIFFDSTSSFRMLRMYLSNKIVLKFKHVIVKYIKIGQQNMPI